MFEIEPFRPTSRRRRLLIVVLAVATAAGVGWLMTRRSGLVRYVQQHPADVAACAPGQSSGCVGSMTEVIVPAPAQREGAASAAAR